ncbi:HlyD family type I secretion periplasmic adaptor subunit [Cohnella sp. GCM10027633]|uniref:HlyD family type I secretion periplasmic adaptor subunit n=1 Tax=unclassified Cohnella TaxID=2636738 RepID=UPI0036439C52
MRLWKRDRLEYEFLPDAIELEQSPPSPLGRVLIWLLGVLFLSCIVWACIGEVDEVAVARGRVMPDGKIQVIQPLEQGVVKEIHVKEGQRVIRGQLLMELDSATTQADIDNLEKELFIAGLEKDMAIAESQGKSIQMNAGKLDDIEYAFEFLLIQQKLMAARAQEYGSRHYSLQLVVNQREHELDIAKSNMESLEKKKRLLEMERNLEQPEAQNSVDLLNADSELYEAERNISVQSSEMSRNQKSLDEAKANLETLKYEREKQILDELIQKEKAYSNLEAELLKSKKRLEFQHLVSPVDGTIHGVSSYTIGGVVTSAQPVITIVPELTPLVIETNILNQDIGFIKTGQTVTVKIDTFPFQKYGSLEGKIEYISPDVFEDERLGLVFKARVALHETIFNVNGQNVPVGPGMTATVEVETGRRKIIEFFLSPIIKYADESLKLR